MIDQTLLALTEARMHDPSACQRASSRTAWLLRVQCPQAREGAAVKAGGSSGRPCTGPGIFELAVPDGKIAHDIPYTLRIDGVSACDTYAFPPEPSAHDLHIFNEGRNYQAYRLLGAVVETRKEVAGVRFRVWAPNAARVSVVGDFNQWDGRVHPMASLGASGVWELFIPGLAAGALYKYELRHRDTGMVARKTDPYGRQFEYRPATASRVAAAAAHEWRDHEWMARRGAWDWLHAPLAVYEVHAGSWMRHPGGGFYNYRELAGRLVPYVRELGYTHIEFMPLDGASAGCRILGLLNEPAFSRPPAVSGSPGDLRFLDRRLPRRLCVGVILDWVPGHFPADDFALPHTSTARRSTSTPIRVCACIRTGAPMCSTSAARKW